MARANDWFLYNINIEGFLKGTIKEGPFWKIYQSGKWTNESGLQSVLVEWIGCGNEQDRHLQYVACVSDSF
jgi:hypothetical protein